MITLFRMGRHDLPASYALLLFLFVIYALYSVPLCSPEHELLKQSVPETKVLVNMDGTSIQGKSVTEGNEAN